MYSAQVIEYGHNILDEYMEFLLRHSETNLPDNKNEAERVRDVRHEYISSVKQAQQHYMPEETWKDIEDFEFLKQFDTAFPMTNHNNLLVFTPAFSKTLMLAHVFRYCKKTSHNFAPLDVIMAKRKWIYRGDEIGARFVIGTAPNQAPVVFTLFIVNGEPLIIDYTTDKWLGVYGLQRKEADFFHKTVSGYYLPICMTALAMIAHPRKHTLYLKKYRKNTKQKKEEKTSTNKHSIKRTPSARWKIKKLNVVKRVIQVMEDEIDSDHIVRPYTPPDDPVWVNGSFKTFFYCEKCKGRVYHRQLGLIICPRCTNPISFDKETQKFTGLTVKYSDKSSGFWKWGEGEGESGQHNTPYLVKKGDS